MACLRPRIAIGPLWAATGSKPNPGGVQRWPWASGKRKRPSGLSWHAQTDQEHGKYPCFVERPLKEPVRASPLQSLGVEKSAVFSLARQAWPFDLQGPNFLNFIQRRYHFGARSLLSECLGGCLGAGVPPKPPPKLLYTLPLPPITCFGCQGEPKSPKVNHLRIYFWSALENPLLSVQALVCALSL